MTVQKIAKVYDLRIYSHAADDCAIEEVEETTHPSLDSLMAELAAWLTQTGWLATIHCRPYNPERRL